MKGITSIIVLLAFISKGHCQLDNNTHDNYALNKTIIRNLDSVLSDWRVSETIKKMESYVYQEPVSLTEEEYKTNLEALQNQVPLNFNRHVKRYINLYSSKKKRNFELVLGLSNLYLTLFEQELNHLNIPEELKWIPVMASSLNPEAVSPSGSSGMWQMMYPMAIRYGLKVTSYIDERRDYTKATKAAATYLSDLYKTYNDWLIVIAAYHSSPAVVNKAMARSGGQTSFWEIYNYLPESTRDYVPAFIATVYCANYSSVHHITNRKIDTFPILDTFTIEKELHYIPIASVLKISEKILHIYNPIYRRAVIPESDQPHLLRLPRDIGEQYEIMKDSIYAFQKAIYLKPPVPPSPVIEIRDAPSYTSKSPTPTIPKNTEKVYYTIKSGDNLGFISSWYNVRVSQIQKWNKMRGTRISAGKKLTLYVPKNKYEYYKAIDNMSLSAKQKLVGKQVSNTNSSFKNSSTRKSSSSDIPNSSSKDYVYHTVRSGDSLWLIAKRYPGVSAENIKKLNNLRTDALRPGQRLKIKKK